MQAWFDGSYVRTRFGRGINIGSRDDVAGDLARSMWHQMIHTSRANLRNLPVTREAQLTVALDHLHNFIGEHRYQRIRTDPCVRRCPTRIRGEMPTWKMPTGNMPKQEWKVRAPASPCFHLIIHIQASTGPIDPPVLGLKDQGLRRECVYDK